METVNEVGSTREKRRSKDRDGLYRRREYWHYELIIDGKKRSFTTGTTDYNEAKKKRAAVVRELQAGRLPNDSGRKRFEAAADEYIRHREATVAAGTVRIDKEGLGPLKKTVGNRLLRDITIRTIRNYQAARATEVSPRTVNLETKLLRGILNYEGQWARLEPEYKRLQKSSQSPRRALTPEESLRLFTIAESHDDWMVVYNAAIVANDSGMRGVELRNLRLRNVNLDGRKISIERTKGRTGGVRTIILTSDALKALIRLLDRARNLSAFEPDHFLFPYRSRKGVTGYDPTLPTKGWRKAWRKLTKEAGMPGFRFHDLRHTFITAHAEAGTPLPVVQATAGHLSRKMTELYTHISTRALQEAAERFERRKADLLTEAKRKVSEQPPSDCVSGRVN